MKFLIVFVALFAVALANVEITKSDVDVRPDGYDFTVATSDGSEQVATAVLNNVGTDHEALVVHGSYSFKDEKTGETFKVNYVADENGFQPQGAHLPVAPQ